MQKSIRKALSISAVVCFMYIGQGCGNEYPVLEFYGPPDYSIFDPGDTLVLEIYAYDPDGLILLVNYSDEDTLKIECYHDDGIIHVPNFSDSKSVTRFIGTDPIVLHLVTDALGAGISLNIDGKKL
jgi:hypothetical protein